MKLIVEPDIYQLADNNSRYGPFTDILVILFYRINMFILKTHKIFWWEYNLRRPAARVLLLRCTRAAVACYDRANLAVKWNVHLKLDVQLGSRTSTSLLNGFSWGGGNQKCVSGFAAHLLKDKRKSWTSAHRRWTAPSLNSSSLRLQKIFYFPSVTVYTTKLTESKLFYVSRLMSL